MGIIILLILLPAPDFFKVWENRKARMLMSINNIDRARTSMAFTAPVTRCVTNLFICAALQMPCGQGLCLMHFIFLSHNPVPHRQEVPETRFFNE